MSKTSKLSLLVALALAAMAVMAAPAFAAATFAEDGALSASENGAGTLSNNAISVTCQTSTASGTATNAGAVTVDTLTFGQCKETLTGENCTVVAGNLPDSFTVTHNATGPHTGDMTSDTTNDPFGRATIHCGESLTCIAISDTTLTAELTNSTGAVKGTLEITNEPIQLAGDAGCGILVPAAWNSKWTIDETDGTNATGTDVTVIYTDTTTTITA
jgi:hypothetical protein